MTVNFIIGRSGSGKTTTIWERVSSRLKAEPLGAPIIILVPEQGSFGAEQGLLAAGGVKGVCAPRRSASRGLPTG